MRNTVIFYRDWYDAVKDFDPEERLKAYDAIMQYSFENKLPEDKFIKAATALMLSTIDRDNDKYDLKCERNRRNIMNRWNRRNGNTTENGSIQPNTTDTNNYNDNLNGNKNDNEPDNRITGENKEKTSKEVKKKSDGRFKKPTTAEVEAYCKERGNFVDAERFIDFYESKGWKVGSTPMKDWKAAVRTWEQRDGRSSKKVSGVKLGVGEWIDEQGERRYGSGKYTVPMDAPARPSENCYWSDKSKQWVSGV